MLKQLSAWIAVVALVAGVSLLLATWKAGDIEAGKAAAAAMPEPSEAVVAATARAGQWSASTRAIGTIVALRQLEIRNELAGSVSELGFKSGDVVEAGQVLVQFDVRQEQASLAAVEAEARLAKVTLDRRAGLRDSPAFSVQEFDKAREDLAAATARAKNLAVVIEKKRIVAPFRARIGITNLQPGAYLDVGTQIAMLQGVDRDAYVDFSLPQDAAAAIRPGATVTLTSPALPGGSAEARVVAEDDSVDRANRTVRFRAVATGLGETFRPGTFVDVTALTAPPRDTILVPLSALRRSPEGEHVFVLVTEDGKTRARQRAVETGPVVGDEISIEKGLAAGETIASAGSFKLREGLLVQTGSPSAPETSAVGVN